MQSKATKEGEIFGAHLRQLRTARGLTQGDVAAGCATSIAFISNVERGLMLPGLAVLLRFAEALECNVSELVEVLDRRRRSSPKSRKIVSDGQENLSIRHSTEEEASNQ